MASGTTLVTRHPGHSEPPWMSAAQVGERLGVTAAAVRQWARDGKLAYAKFGPQTMRFAKDDVDALIEAGYVAAGDRSR